MKSYSLGSYHKEIPALGFGTWQVPSNEVAQLVKSAVNVGYTHIDCAHVYQNEFELGSGFFGSYHEREKLFITSKLWGTDHEPSRVRTACEFTIKNLQCAYLDLYLIHNPCRMDYNAPNLFTSLYFKREWITETWREMEKLVEAGLCKTIGVSNFTTKKLEDLLCEASIKPCVNQVELHPYLKQDKLLKYCNENDIHITAYSPLGTPGTRNTPFGKPTAPILLEDAIITSIAKSREISPAQVLIAWGISRGTSVLVKSSSEARMKENLQAASVILSADELSQIQKICVQERYLDFGLFLTKGNTLNDSWDGELFN